MKWCSVPYSFLAMTKPSEYSDESRLEVRPAHAKYLFVYPFVKTREWYTMPGELRWRIMQEHIKVGREYPSIDLNTSYSFGLDDQEFVVAFETDNPADFLDLVQRLRTTEASAYTKRDTPTFTCISCSVERALGALDGAALADAGRAMTLDPARLATDFDEVRDITVIGAGPVGLATAFWAGMREADARIIDSLPELGGQLTTLYPEKWIFDVPGHPRVLARELVDMLRVQALEQFDVPVHLSTTAESISWEGEGEDRVVVLHTDRGELRSRTVIVAGGHGAFEPKKLPGLRHDAVGGPRRALPRGREGGVRRQAGADRRRRRLGDGLGDQPARHRRVGDARAPPRGLPRPRADRRAGDGGRRPRRGRGARPVSDPRGERRRLDRARPAVPLRGRGARAGAGGRRDPAPARVQDRARPAEGVGLRGGQGRASRSTR